LGKNKFFIIPRTAGTQYGKQEKKYFPISMAVDISVRNTVQA
jgi:hypothetical protein